MYRERLVECGDCGVRFKIVYDSRKEKQEEYTCKCGKLVCYPNSYGSFKYDIGGNPKKIPYEESGYKHEYYEEDYIRLTEEEQNLLKEIDEIGNTWEGYYSPYTNYSDDECIQLELCGCSKLNEGLKISLDIKLQSDDSWSVNEAEQTHKRILEGLTRFKNIIVKVKNGEMDLDNPRKIWNDNTLEWNGGTKEQLEIYDYELEC